MKCFIAGNKKRGGRERGGREGGEREERGREGRRGGVVYVSYLLAYPRSVRAVIRSNNQHTTISEN